MPNALNVLLALQHLRDRKKALTDQVVDQLSSPEFFNAEQIRRLDARIAKTTLFKRTQLPLSCWHCKSDEFDYTALKCGCGTALYANADSMTYIIETR
ncbi:MAG: hypothetical protein ACOYOH_25835, partial [Paracraurococcus sp.]